MLNQQLQTIIQMQLAPQKQIQTGNKQIDRDMYPFRIRRQVNIFNRRNFCSTRNNIHHYSSVIKKVLYQALKKKRLTEGEVNRTNNKLSKVTGLKNFVQAFWSPRVSSVLRESVESGLFVRLFLEAHIYNSNKCQGLRYLNRLFNSFYTGVLDRWVDTGNDNSQANQADSVVIKEEAVEIKTQEAYEMVKQEAYVQNMQLCKLEDVKVEYEGAMVSMCKEEYTGTYNPYGNEYVDPNYYSMPNIDIHPYSVQKSQLQGQDKLVVCEQAKFHPT